VSRKTISRKDQDGGISTGVSSFLFKGGHYYFVFKMSWLNVEFFVQGVNVEDLSTISSIFS
jgi:hypothetical protein